MFDITGDAANGYNIAISRGDTGAIRFIAHAKYRGTDTPYTFGERDRAVFSIKNGSGTVVKEKISAITDNKFVVVFHNPDTDQLAIGTNYTWDVRYIINPYYDESGRIADGDQVITPRLPAQMNLLTVVGDV